MLLILNLLAFVVVFVALVRIFITPTERWARGRLSKVAWTVAVVWWLPTVDSVAFPIGAAIALWHISRINRQPSTEPPDLPFAEGSPERDAR